MESHAEAYLKRLLEAVVPICQAAPGLSALTVLRRSLVGYEEIAIVTTWESEEHMQSFSESSALSSPCSVLIQREPPHVYQIVFEASHAQAAES